MNTIESLARSLGVSAASLQALGATRNDSAWTFPERDAEGQIIGTARRLDDGQKLMETGSKRGLTMAWPLDSFAGSSVDEPILIVEGVSDTAAGMDQGFVMIGRPSATGGLKYLRPLLRDRHVVIVGENDSTGIGRSGAEKLAADLHEVVASVKLIFPPECAKDLRDWYTAPAGCSREDLLTAIRAAEAYKPREVFNLTELGNADRLVDQHGENLLYCQPFGFWFVWDGRRWVKDETHAVHRRAELTVRSILVEAAKESDRKKRRDLAVWSHRSETRHALAAMVDLARHKLPATPDQLDVDAWKFNVLNGTLDLRGGELRKHDRADLITRIALVNYDADAKCPRWLKFLDEIMNGSEDLIRFLRMMAGYCLTGDTSERCLFILFGNGANGKTVFIEVLWHVLGDYAIRTPAETLLTKRGDSIPNDVARLKGSRFVTVAETEDGRRLNEARIKELTGGDTITARFLHAEWFDFKPECKFIIATNHRPVIRGRDDAIWERIRLVPFTFTIPKDKRDLKLRDRLIRDEAAGILAWAVRGCAEWRKSENGLVAPPEVTEATAAYKDEMDVVSAFIDECCRHVEMFGEGAPATPLYEAYKRWTVGRAMSQKQFGGRLGKLGYKSVRDTKSNRKVWKGIELIELIEEPNT